jgi:four helix bundle protein
MSYKLVVMAKSILKDKSFRFAVDSINLYKKLVVTKKEYVLSKQFVRSATSVGALIREAQNAESTKDFIHKLGIAQKECDETLYWLELLAAADYIVQEEMSEKSTEANELLRMLRSAILTSKQKNS